MMQFNIRDGVKTIKLESFPVNDPRTGIIATYLNLPIYPGALENQPVTADDVYAASTIFKSVQTGIAMFDKISFEFPEDSDDGFKVVAIKMPDSTIIHPTNSKRKVVTELSGRDASVQEIVNSGSWSLRIFGVIINTEVVGSRVIENNDYPLQQVATMKDLFKINSNIKIVSRLCQALDIFHVNVDYIDFPPTPGYANSQMFEIRLTQDEPIELIINPAKQ